MSPPEPLCRYPQPSDLKMVSHNRAGEEAPLAPELFEEFATVIRLLGHAQRLRIIEFLDLRGESCVGDIAAGVGGRQPAVSQHLNRMRSAGVIAARRRGREMHYRIITESPVTILNCIRRQLAAGRVP